MAQRKSRELLFDTELADLSPESRWREWMNRVEAVIFASTEPVTVETLTRVVGRECSIELIIDDIRDGLFNRPYELVKVAGGWHYRTRAAYSDAINAASTLTGKTKGLSETEALVLMTIAYFQPLTRAELSSFFGREISRDLIANLRQNDFIGSGPRSPQPGAPYTYVTTSSFLSHFGFESLRDMPDMEKLEDAGLLSRTRLLNDIHGALASALGQPDEDD